MKTYFERALFFSWYCGLGDCTFCYMSTTNEKQDAKKARRSFESIFAEALISKVMDWKIEFVSGGYDSYTKEELLELVKGVYEITGEKVWLNIGVLSEEELVSFKPYAEGYAGTIETVNWEIRKKVCPSKKIEPIMKTFEKCDKIGLKKSITIIIGLGETIEDFENLKKFIIENGISRVTFYALNPHPGTPFKKSPSKEYYAEWIRKTRDEFADLEIIAGAWIDKPEYYYEILKAGADNFTKLPSIRQFGCEKFKEIEKQIEKAGKELNGTLTKLPKVDWETKIKNLSFSKDMKVRIKTKLNSYLKSMNKSSNYANV